jgi:potassium uptake TrkH family protein
MHPTRTVVLGFLALIAVGTVLLLLPVAHRTDSHPGWVNCFFTATSAVTVTGLTVVDATTWSSFGQLVLLLLVQLGGFGIMTLGAVLVLVASQRIGLRQRMAAQTEIGSLSIGDVGRLVRTIAVVTVSIEGATALVLSFRLWQSGREQGFDALWSGTFHAVMAFNNAGMSLYDDNLAGFVRDPVFLVAVSAAIILGGLGFPVILELTRERRAKWWSLHTKVTLFATALLLVAGPLLVVAFEWTNTRTLGHMPVWEKALNGWFQGVSPRTAGFNTVDIAGLREGTALIVFVLMFIGAGAASTGGGIRVTTFAIVGWVAWNEVRGNRETSVFKRRIPSVSIGQALVVIVLSIGLIFMSTVALLTLEPISALDAGFEAASAFGTVGLTRGVTGTLGPVSHVLLALVMLAGRVGPTTFASAVISRERPQLYRYPEERPLIG